MRIIVYGEGGYDPTLPNDNIVEDYDDGTDQAAVDGSVTVQVDLAALGATKTQVDQATTVAGLRSALSDLVALMTPES